MKLRGHFFPESDPPERCDLGGCQIQEMHCEQRFRPPDGWIVGTTALGRLRLCDRSSSKQLDLQFLSTDLGIPAPAV